MNDLSRFQATETAITRKSEGNRDGKGVNGFMLDWHQSKPRGVTVKPGHQLLAEFFTSMLVLSAQFKYKPAVGVRNYLYWTNGEWSLSLISPDQWTEERGAGFAGTFVLQPDMTWTIRPSERLSGKNPVSAEVARFFDAFAATLDSDLTLEEVLPIYVNNFPYYQRLYASALSRSIRAAATLGNQASSSCRRWQTILPQIKTGLLANQS